MTLGTLEPTLQYHPALGPAYSLILQQSLNYGPERLLNTACILAQGGSPVSDLTQYRS